MRSLIATLITFFASHCLCGQTIALGSGNAFNALGSGYAEIPSGMDSLEFPFTITAWVQPTTFTNFSSPIFSSQVNDTAFSGITILSRPYSIDVIVGDGSGLANTDYRQYSASTSRPFLRGEWTHIAVKFNSESNIQVYVNGIFKAASLSGTGGAMDTSPTRKSAIGYSENGQASYFQGNIDEFGIWERGLSPTEIRKIMTTGVKSDTLAQILRYSMEGSTTSLVDGSSNGWDASLVGSSHTFPLSGAAIGDTSVWLYSRNNNVTLSWPGGKGPTVSVNSSQTWGVYLYRILGTPPSTIGLSPCPEDTIWGAFHIYQSSFGGPYPIVISGYGNTVVSRRESNVDTLWASNSFPSGSFVDTGRTEFISDRYLQSNGFLLTPDTFYCGSSYVLRGADKKPGISYLWSNGDTTQNTTVSATGRYFLEVTSDCFTQRDSVFMTFYDQPQFDVSDTIICSGTSLSIGLPSLAGGTYLWSNGQVGDTASFSSPGIYYVSANNGPCTATDTFEITILPDLSIPDFSLCGNQPTVVLPNAPGIQYTWSDGSTNSEFSPTVPGTYWVIQQISSCSQIDTFEVEDGLISIDELPDFKTVCRDQNISLTVADLGYSIEWSNGDQGLTTSPNNSGWLTVAYQTPCGPIKDSVYIDILSDCKEVVFFEPNSFSPNGDGINDIYHIKGFTGRQFHVYVFDRWGRQVFESTNPNFEWDGGEEPSGVYIARFTFRNAQDEEGEKTIQITLYK